MIKRTYKIIIYSNCIMNTTEELKETLKSLIIPLTANIILDHYDRRALESIIKNIQKYSNTKNCTICKISKPLKKYNSGHSECISCIKGSNYHKKYYELNKEKMKIKKLKLKAEIIENNENFNIPE